VFFCLPPGKIPGGKQALYYAFSSSSTFATSSSSILFMPFFVKT